VATSKAERRYGNPPSIKSKLAMPTAQTAAAAKPEAKEAAGTDSIPVTATTPSQGDKRV